MNNLDKQYQNLLKDIIDNGSKKGDRTGTGTISVFKRNIRHNMSEGFPLLTTKKMYVKGVVAELIWFLRGDTKLKYLLDNNCNIWNGDAFKKYKSSVMISSNPHDRHILSSKPSESVEGMAEFKIGEDFNEEEFIEMIKNDEGFASRWGDLGPIYGKQWRDWGGTIVYGPNGFNLKGIDQIKTLIDDLKKNPDSRRLMVTAWNPTYLPYQTLPPCHYGFQVYTRELKPRERTVAAKQLGIELSDGQKSSAEWDKECDEKNVPKRSISLGWNQRSVDTFLGLPFNIASYGLLLMILGKLVNMVPEELIGDLGDTHLYLNHIDQANEQIGRERSHEERVEIYNNLESKKDVNGGWTWDTRFEDNNITKRTREPYPLPQIRFSDKAEAIFQKFRGDYKSDYGTDFGYYNQLDAVINSLEVSDFILENYQSHQKINAPLSN